MFKYMYGIFQLMITILMLVRSFREANFKMLIAVLKDLAPLFFALDHTNYDRWLSVFIQDLQILPESNPTLFKEFVDGKFAIQSTETKFSKMAFDQCHEQNNKKIKATSGYINIVNQKNENFLRQLEISTPEIQEYLQNFENIKTDTPPKHKEAMESFINKFLGDCKIVMDKFLMNPFKEERLKKLNNLSFLYPQTIERDAAKVFEIGKSQYSNFVWSRFVLGSADVVKTPINRNGLKLPKDIKKGVTNITPD